MTAMIITDIKESDYDSSINLITATVLSDKLIDIDRIPFVAKKILDDLLVLERATAEKELPAIGVHKGDQFLRIWAKSDHGLNVGDKIRFGDGK